MQGVLDAEQIMTIQKKKSLKRVAVLRIVKVAAKKRNQLAAHVLHLRKSHLVVHLSN
jgi:hypothetical protein